MCELFGLSSRDKIEVNEYLRAFFRHSEQHPHGWGLAQFFGNAVQIEKEPVAAVESQYLNTRLSFPIDAKSLIAHIRLAPLRELPSLCPPRHRRQGLDVRPQRHHLQPRKEQRGLD